MKTAALFTLLIAASVSARAILDLPGAKVAKPEPIAAQGNAGSPKNAPPAVGSKAKGVVAGKAKGTKVTNNKNSNNNNGTDVSNASNNNGTDVSIVSSSNNGTDVSNNNNNGTDVSNNNNNNNNNATATSTAGSATRTRPCDQGDQSLAAGLQAAQVIGIGQQASVLTLQAATAAADFTAGVTRLQQFTDTMSLQLQMAQGIADDGSFAQVQLKLLAASQTSQEGLVKQLSAAGASAQASNDTLTQLLQSFADSTNNAQDGAEQALIDCFIPLTAVSA